MNSFIHCVVVIFHSYVLEKVDQVIVGAEGVVESGGIINKVSCKVTARPLIM